MANCNCNDTLVEEIALEGLEGLTLPSLWVRLEEREDFQLTLNERVQAYLWEAVVSHDELTFYQLPEPRKDVEKFERFQHMHTARGIYHHPESHGTELYGFEPVNEGGVVGSCTTFKTRKDVTGEVRDEDGNILCSYEDAMERWGRSLVAVASQSQRNVVLTGSPITLSFVNEGVIQFCLLERIGRSRRNGLTSGSFIPNYSTSPLGLPVKTLFYNFQILADRKLVRKQRLSCSYKNQCVVMNLMHLTRFYCKVPNTIMDTVRSLCQHLSQQPGKRQICNDLRKTFHLNTKKSFEEVKKHMRGYYHTEKMLYREVFPSASKEEYLSKNGGERQATVMVLDKDLEEEEEEDEEDRDCDEAEDDKLVNLGRMFDTGTVKWRYDRAFLQQVYALIHEAGIQGIAIKQVALSLGLAFRFVYNAIKTLNAEGAIKSILTAKGKHRTSIYVAQPFLEASSLSFGKALAEFHQKTTELAGESTVIKGNDVIVLTEADEKEEKEGKSSGEAAGEIKQDVHEGEMLLTRSTQGSQDGRHPAEPSIKLSHVTCTFRDTPFESPRGHTAKAIRTEKLTEKMLMMANTLLDVVQRHRVLESIHILRKCIIACLHEMHEDQVEEEGAIEHNLCLKTVRRLVEWCEKEDKLLTYTCCLQHKNRTYEMMMICGKDITRDHQLVANAIEQTKLRVFGLYQPETNKKKIPQSLGQSFTEWWQLNELAKQASESAVSSIDKKIKGKQKNTRKLEKVRLLHRFLWYIIYGYQGTEPANVKDTTKGEHSVSQGTEEGAGPSSADGGDGPSSADGGDGPSSAEGGDGPSSAEGGDGETKEPPVYLDIEDWRRYIKPLRRYDDAKALLGRSDGVCSIGDLLLVMPLSLFVKLTNVEMPDVIKDFLLDDRKRNYPLTALPVNVLGHMLRIKVYMISITEVCQNLCRLGLLAMGPLMAHERSKQFLFLRKSGLLLNTTYSAPGQIMTSLPEGMTAFPEIRVRFDSLENVDDFWRQMQTIAFATPLNRASVSDKECVHTEETQSLSEALAYQKFGNIPEDFCLPGNRRGAAGADSTLYVHLVRNWAQVAKLNTTERETQLGETLRPGTELPTVKQMAGPKEKPLAKKKPADRGISSKACKSTATAAKKTTSAKVGKKGKKGAKEKGPVHVVSKKKAPKSALRTARISCRKAAKRKERKSVAPLILDETDVQANSLKTVGRRRFSLKEGSVVMLGKVALHFLVGIRPGPLQRRYYSAIRDIIHQRFGERSADKTIFSIQSFIMRQMHNRDVRLNLAQHLMRVRQDKEFMAKFSPHVIRSDQKLPSEQDFYAVLMDMMNDLLDKYQGFVECVHRSTGLRAATVQSLQDYEMLVGQDPLLSGTKEITVHWKDVKSDLDIWGVVLRNFHLSHMLSTWDKQSRNYEMFATLRQYPENIVSNSFNELLNTRMVSKNKGFPYTAQNPYGNSRFLLHSRHLLCKTQNNCPEDLCTTGIELLLSIAAKQKLAAETSRRGQAEGQTASTSQGQEGDKEVFCELPQGIATPGHLAVAIGLTATRKIRLKVEMGPNMVHFGSDVSSMVLNKPDSGGQKTSMKRKQTLSGHKPNTGSYGEDDPVRAETVTATQEGVPAKKARTDEGSSSGAASTLIAETSQSQGQARGEKRPAPDDSSDEQSSSKQLKPSTADDETTATTDSSVNQNLLPRDAMAGIEKDADGLLKLKGDVVSVTFTPWEEGKESTPEMGDISANNSRASYSLVQLRRIIPESFLNPSNKPNVTRVTIHLSKVAVSLKNCDGVSSSPTEDHVTSATMTPVEQGETSRSQGPVHLQPNSGDGSVNSEDGQGASSSVTGDHVPSATTTPVEQGQSSRSEVPVDHAYCGATTLVEQGVTSLFEERVWIKPSQSDTSDIFVKSEVLKAIVQEQTKLLPFTVDMNAFWEGARQDLDGEGLKICRQLYVEILRGGALGLTWQQMQVKAKRDK
ncbi:general transcription factor 3C polypeptide 1-like [Littorina saxatilis]|uniref:general transcription factor 3C polypeptide 1-like n=1 Tax=Littorina saxatilis TaxID=31220 RepID=UPI0038B495FB